MKTALTNKIANTLYQNFYPLYKIVNNQAIQPAGCNLIILINLAICLCTFTGFVESHSHIFPIEEGEYDHEYDEVPSDEETADKDSTPEVW